MNRIQSDHPKFLDYVNRSFGFRGGGSIGDIVFMAANPIDRTDETVYILAFNGVTDEFIDGAFMALGPTIGPEGNIYASIGRGKGYINFHAYDRDGILYFYTIIENILTKMKF